MSINNSRQISDVKVLLKTGIDGSSIESIEKTGTVGLVDTYTITLTNGLKTTFTVTNGNGIVDVEKTGTAGKVDTYTITFDNGETTTFTVTNGADTNAQIAEKVTNPATRAYAVGEYVVFNDSLCEVTVAIPNGGTFAINTNLKATTVMDELSDRDASIIANTQLIDETVGWINKNEMLRSSVIMQDSSYLDLIRKTQADYSIFVNGTPSGDVGAQIYVGFLKAGKYILNGCISGGSDSKYNLQLYYDNDSHNVKDYGSGVEFTSSTDGIVKVYLNVKSGVTVTNAYFKPMIRDANILDDSYAEPKYTTAFPRDEQAVLGAVNQFNYDAWKSVGISNGTAIFENNGVSLTATANNCYTRYELNDSYPADAKIPVIEGKTIKLLWKCTETTVKGGVLICPNGQGASAVSAYNNAEKLEYTPASGIDFVTIRFGVTTSGDNVHYKDIMVVFADNADDMLYAPYAMTNKELTDSKFPRDEQAVLSARNRLPAKYKDGTGKVDGSLTWSVDSDGVVDANGSTGDTQSVFWLTDNVTFKEALRLVGCPSGASSSTYCFGGTYVGAEVTKDIPANTQFSVACVVKANQTVDHIKFKPLLKLATDPTDDFSPPAMTNRELTEEIATKQKKLDYSTSEQKTGLTFAGRDVYKKTYVVDSGSFNTSATMSVAFDRTWGDIVSLNAIAMGYSTSDIFAHSNPVLWRPLGYYSESDYLTVESAEYGGTPDCTFTFHYKNSAHTYRVKLIVDIFYVKDRLS